MKTKISLIFILLLFLNNINAQKRITLDGVQYTTISDSSVCAYLTVKAIGDVDIKGAVIIKGNTYKTSQIGRSYFNKNEYIQSVVIPNSVSLIEKDAFKNCNNLTRLIVPDTLCVVEENAFRGCLSVAYISTNTATFSPDYILSFLDKSIPYYKVKEEFDMKNLLVAADENLDEILEDIEFDVDKEIPVSKLKNKNLFAFVIGNESYAEAPDVAYAKNDASVFGEYCRKTLGIPDDNVKIYDDVTFGKMLRVIRDVKAVAEAYKEKCSIIFYYAGHGIPDETTKDAFLLPVDGDGKTVEGCYSLGRLYSELGKLPAKKIIVFLDACFSGALRGNGMLMSARGLALKANVEQPKGNMIVYSASSGNETAFPYEEKQHGMFTYYLLNMLKRSRGNCTIGELSDYIQAKVQQKSIVINQKQQTPTLTFSSNNLDDWRNQKIK